MRENCIALYHEHILQMNHVVSCPTLVQVQGSMHYANLAGTQTRLLPILALMKGDESFQLLSFVFLGLPAPPKASVQTFDQRKGHRPKQNDHKFYQRNHFLRDCQLIWACAQRLGQYFPEDQDQSHTDEHSEKGPKHFMQENGQSLHCDGICDEQSH